MVLVYNDNDDPEFGYQSVDVESYNHGHYHSEENVDEYDEENDYRTWDYPEESSYEGYGSEDPEGYLEHGARGPEGYLDDEIDDITYQGRGFLVPTSLVADMINHINRTATTTNGMFHAKQWNNVVSLIDQECSVCFEKKLLLQDGVSKRFYTLQDLASVEHVATYIKNLTSNNKGGGGDPEEGHHHTSKARDPYKVMDNYMVLGPCLDRDHSVCLGCLKRVLQDRSLLSTMLSANEKGQLTCLASSSSAKECCKATYDLSQGPKMLMSKTQFENVSSVVARYQDKTRDHHVFPCVTEGCGNTLAVKFAELDYAESGKLIVSCTACKYSFCYHCHKTISPSKRGDVGYSAVGSQKDHVALNEGVGSGANGPDHVGSSTVGSQRDHVAPIGGVGSEACGPDHVERSSSERVCMDCIFEKRESRLPFALNRYVVSTSTSAAEEEHNGYVENCNVQWSDVKRHLDRLTQAKRDVMACHQGKEKIFSSRFYEHCSVCDAAMEKSTECNELSHCGQHICCMCGRRALPGRPLESSHWKTCLRFNSSKRGKEMLKGINHRCSDHLCNMDTERCSEPNHQEGIKNLELYRIHTHIHSLLRSLPIDMNVKAVSYLSSSS